MYLQQSHYKEAQTAKQTAYFDNFVLELQSLTLDILLAF